MANAGNSDWTELVTTTIEKRQKKITENVFTGQVLLSILWDMNKVHFSGGTELVSEAFVDQGNTFRMNAKGEMPVGRKEVISAMVYDWRYFGGQFSYNIGDLVRNTGDPAFIDMIAKRAENLEMSLTEHANEDLAGTLEDGTAVAGTHPFFDRASNVAVNGAIPAGSPATYDQDGTAANDIEGMLGMHSIPTLCVGGLTFTNGEVTGADTFAGIPGTASYWWPKARYRSGNVAIDETDWSAMFRAAGRGGTDNPDVCIASDGVYGAYEKLQINTKRSEHRTLAKGGFEHVTYKGRPLAYTGITMRKGIYFLNTKYLMAVCHSGWWMKTLDPERTNTKAEWDVQTICAGNLMTTRRASLGAVIYDQDNNMIGLA